MADDAYVRQAGSKPAIMARITSLTALLELFHLKENGPDSATLRLEVQDPIVEENQGTFDWRLTRAGAEAGRIGAEAGRVEAEAGRVEAEPGRVEAAEATRTAMDEKPHNSLPPTLSCTISQLTSWIFGYQTARQVWPEAGDEVIGILESVNRVERVFIDEVV